MKSTVASSALPGDPMRVDVPLAVLGRLRRQATLGQRGDERRRELDGVHELALGASRMHGLAVDGDPDPLRGEGLDLELAEPGSVERVRDVRAERLEVEVLGPPPHLLVDGESDADRSVPTLRMPDEVGDGGHDLGDPGLVVGAEERRAVARHDVVPHTRGEIRQHARVEHLAAVARKRDRSRRPIRGARAASRRRRGRPASCRRGR